MAALHGINFSDPVISSKNNRDGGKSMSCRSSRSFSAHADNGFSFSGAVSVDYETKTARLFSVINYPLGRSLYEFYLSIFHASLACFVRRVVRLRSPRAIRFGRDLYIGVEKQRYLLGRMECRQRLDS